MWALVNNTTNSIEVGPRDWNRWVFQGYLSENHNITTSLTQLAPTDTNCIVITDTLSIVEVDHQDNLDGFNQAQHQLVGPNVTVSNGQVISSYGYADKDINIVKSDLKNQLAANRYKREVGGTSVNVNGQNVKVDTDRVARQVWPTAVQVGVNNANFKLSTTTWLNLSSENISLIHNTVTDHVQNTYDWEYDVSSQIDAAQDFNTLFSIDLGHVNPRRMRGNVVING